MGAADSRALLQQAQTALEAGDWDEARARFGRVLALGDSAEARAGLAQALQWLGLFDAAIDARERAFAAFRHRRMPLEASQQARWLAFLDGAVNGNTAAAMGWFARAEALLDGLDESVEHGWLAFDRAPLVQDRGERRRLADSAVRIARAHGDLDLECGALALLGESYVSSGRIAEGMKPIDQAMAAVSSGEVRAVVTAGDVYCRLLSA